MFMANFVNSSSSLEIGTWSNEMAQMDQQQAKSAQADFDIDSDFDPFEALPPNLTFLDDASLPQINPDGDKRDWGTGIAQKKFRVGSPTFFRYGQIFSSEATLIFFFFYLSNPIFSQFC